VTVSQVFDDIGLQNIDKGRQVAGLLSTSSRQLIFSNKTHIYPDIFKNIVMDEIDSTTSKEKETRISQTIFFI
jgi:hypothetical protein